MHAGGKRMPPAIPSCFHRGACTKSTVVARPVWIPHASNGLSQASLVTLLRKALVQVCGLSERQASRFTVHSLRVGGINYYKRIGVSIGMRAKIASHKSLVTSRKYLRLLPVEKLVELSTMTEPN